MVWSPLPAASFPIWMTVKLGICKTPDEYRMALKKAEVKIDSWADAILSKTVVNSEELEINLVSMSVAELGFTDRTYYVDICQRGVALGLQLCPAEIGPALCLAYKYQPNGNVLLVAMEAIRDPDGDPSIFGIASNDGLSLTGFLAYPKISLLEVSHFVFVCPSSVCSGDAKHSLRKEAVTAYDAGLRLMGEHNLKEAYGAFALARDLYLKGGDAIGGVQSLLKLIEYHEGMAEDERARPLCEQALEILRTIDAPRFRGLVLLMRHWCAADGEAEDQLAQRLRKALSLLQHDEEPQHAAAAHRALAQLIKRSGHLSEARTNYLQAIPLYEAAGSLLGAPGTLHELAHLELEHHHLNLAHAYLQMAISRLQEVPLIGARLTESNCYECFGDLWLARGKTEESRWWYRKSHDACQRFEFSKKKILEKLAALEEAKK